MPIAYDAGNSHDHFIPARWSAFDFNQGQRSSVREQLKLDPCQLDRPAQFHNLSHGFPLSCSKYLIIVTIHCAMIGSSLFVVPGNSFASGYGGVIAAAIFLAAACVSVLLALKMRGLIATLRQSEQQYQKILEDQTDLICRFRSDDTILYVNDACCRFFGKSRDQLIGQTWRPLVMSTYAERVSGQLNALSRSNPIVVIENPLVGARGEIRWYQFANQGFFDEAGNLTEIQSVGRDISKQKDLELALSANEQEFRSLAEAMPHIVWINRPDGWTTYFNQQWVDYTGLSLEESYGVGWNRPFHPDDQLLAWDAWQHAIESNGSYSIECRIRRFDGTYRWWLVRGVPILDKAGKISKWFGTCTDIQEFKDIQAELELAATAFNANVGIVVTDPASVILRVNQAYSEQTGYAAEEITGKTPKIFQSGRHSPAFYREMWDSIEQDGFWQGEVWDRKKNGSIYPNLLTVTAIRSAGGTIKNYIGTQVDISNQKMAEEKIRRLAFFDPLTKLPNRRLLMDRLHQALSSSTRSGKGAALMFIDLDDFKTLNDTLGHAVGDLLLEQVAVRLECAMRQCDTVARLGGDEFVVMLEELSANEVEAAVQTEETSRKIISALNEPYYLTGHAHRSTASIGCTVFFDHRQTAHELLKQADIAMYQAKRDGRNLVRFYDERMQRAINMRVLLEKEIRTALKLGQFSLYYQLQKDEGGQVLGAEALIRWNHPQRGLVYPADFIPVSEDSDLILEIGKWVLQTACHQIKIWQDNAAASKLTLAVNISPKHFRQGDFSEELRTIIRQHGIDPNRLKLELTESILLDRTEATVSTMHGLKKNGVQFSLDDFGTGYSSLQYLKQLPFNQLKIAEPFVRDIAFDDNDRAIVCAIISMGQTLNLDVLAEGVETEEQHQFLLQNGCSHFQGFLFSEPLPVHEFEALLDSGNGAGR